jgi:hypothetical protein
VYREYLRRMLDLKPAPWRKQRLTREDFISFRKQSLSSGDDPTGIRVRRTTGHPSIGKRLSEHRGRFKTSLSPSKLGRAHATGRHGYCKAQLAGTPGSRCSGIRSATRHTHNLDDDKAAQGPAYIHQTQPLLPPTETRSCNHNFLPRRASWNAMTLRRCTGETY